MEFPEETTEDDDESSSSYQSAKDNLNSKSEVVSKSELDAVDSANTPETNSPTQQTNKKSDEMSVASPKNDDALKLKDAYKSNKTVSTPRLIQ